MTISLYNTLTGKKETFIPLREGKVGMYVCGPTVYDSCHIGHARSAIVFDVITRYFTACGFDVTYVRNFTDVDDKIINRANQLGISSHEVSEKYIREFYADMDALYVQRPTHEPYATKHISEIIELVETLIQKNFAYEIDGDVYFRVESFAEYGKLSGRKLEDMEAGARIDVDKRKDNPFDFALWKSAKPDEPSWESPWGLGRPGWHIECSAMSSKYLGERFDIHGGGKDLIFPHHENEIAQSEAAHSKPFVNYWVHNGFVNIDSEKMSKSLGNFLLIKDVLKRYHPEAIRLFLLSSHYRSPIDFIEQSMDEASQGLDKIYSLMDRLNKANIRSEAETSGDYRHRFSEAMNDDFNTAKGIGILFEAVRTINRTLDEDPAGEASRKTIACTRLDLEKMGSVLGILHENPEDYFNRKKNAAIEEEAIDAAWVEEMIQSRKLARKEKNWAKADQIREALEKMNIIIEDRPDGTIWKVMK
ncbi:MAG: cysteine--tRNA ligase [Pseudomonadota bacterium]